jgi:VWFA-related protein
MVSCAAVANRRRADCQSARRLPSANLPHRQIWNTYFLTVSKIFLLLAAGLGGRAQAPDVRVTTRLVQVNVVVAGGSGKSSRLSKEDFRLFDNGKPRPIELFVASPGGDPTPAATPLPPRVYSNRYERPAATVSIVLLDVLNTPTARHAAAKAKLIESLNGLAGRRQVALYVLDSALRVLHDFTDDPAQLGAALARYRSLHTAAVDLNPGRSGLGPNDAIAGTPLGQMAAQADQSLAAFNQLSRATITLAALEAIARHVRHIPGRKSLVWISSYFPLAGRRGFDEEVNRVARVMNQADIAIYPVSDGGLATLPALSAESGPGGGRGRPVSVSPVMGDSSMRALAEESGGQAYYNTNDLPAAVERALADAQTSYTLGFYPPENALDGKFHEIRVQVRQRGFTLRHRRGYLAAAEARDAGAEMESMLASPFQSASVKCSVRVDPAEGGLRLLIGIDLATLDLEAKDGRRAGVLDLVLVEQSDAGVPVNTSREAVRLDLTPAQYDQYLKDGLVLVKNLKPAAATYQVRLLLQDRTSGRVGSVFVPGIQELAKP